MADPQTPDTDHATGGRAVAWTGFGFGSLVSVAANVLAERIAPAHANATWTPSVQAELAAAVWPIALLISVELLARVRWRHGWQWLLARFGGAGLVAVGSAFISYSHIHAVLINWRYSDLGAGVGPLVIDGLMTISGFALLAAGQPTAEVDTAPRDLTDYAATLTAPPVPAVTDAHPASRPAKPAEIEHVTTTPAVLEPASPSVDAPSGELSQPDATTPGALGASTSNTNVVSISGAASTRDQMLAYLGENPDATGADLDRRFGTRNYGRGVRRSWLAQRDQRIASGE